MVINLKEVAREALNKLPGDDLDAIIQFAVTDKSTVSCTIAGEAIAMKAMLCSILEHDEPRALFEECYSLVLAKRAGINNESANPNNN